ncbi:MAG: hypothetical protein JWN26_457 [Candidatus Saccharibacteria bacterium]|nr:hypothetical protein [Candidatus Saccharibacteria bacterium]
MRNQDKYLIKSAAYIIPRRGNQVLLSLREGTGYMDGNYGLVAGHIEANETAEDGAIREAKEESSIVLTKDQLKFVFLMHRVSADPVDSYIDIFFEVTNWQGEFTNMEPEKCGGLDWFDINQLPENTVPYIAQVLNSYQSGQTYVSRRKEDV